jgi:hypothetical protein
VHVQQRNASDHQFSILSTATASQRLDLFQKTAVACFEFALAMRHQAVNVIDNMFICARSMTVQARQVVTGEQVAVKTLLLRAFDGKQRAAVLRGCRINIACAAAPAVLPMYAVLQV